jgi:UDP-glucose 6-dehydrogenase
MTKAAKNAFLGMAISFLQKIARLLSPDDGDRSEWE